MCSPYPGRRRSKALLAAGIAALLLCAGDDIVSAFDDAEVRAIVANRKEPGEFPGHGGIWMARQKRVDIDGVGNATISEHILARVFDPEWGEQMFRPYRRPFWSYRESPRLGRMRVWRTLDEFEVIPPEATQNLLHPDVEGVLFQQFYRELRIDVPELRRGDVVELEIFWTDRIPGYEYNVRWLEHVFGAEIPVIEEQLTIAIPMAASIDVRQLGPDVHSRTISRDAVRIQTWLTGNLPPIAGPVLETPWSRIIPGPVGAGEDVPRVLFSTVADWHYLSAYFGARWESAIEHRGSEMDRIVSAVLMETQDFGSRAAALDTYVRERIRTLPIPELRLPIRPLPAETVAREGAGSPRDKACLLVSLLRMAGVPAQAAMVRTRGGEWIEDMACLAQLDRFVVRARPAGHPEVWMDPVGQGAEAGSALILNGLDPGTFVEGETGLIIFPGIHASD